MPDSGPIPASTRTPSEQSWFAAFGGLRQADWSERRVWASLALLPAVALSLAWGAWLSDPVVGVMAAGGAVTIGFGAFQRLACYRTLPLGVTLVAMAVSTFAGSVGHRGGWAADVSMAIVWGWVFGLVTTLGWGAWWVGLQGMVALLVFGSFPADARTALYHSAMMIAGGVVQLLAVFVVRRFVRIPDQPTDAIPSAWWGALIKHASPATAGGRHALRVALALGLGSGIHQAVGLTHGNWVPMTAAILLKPDLKETYTRVLARLAGTLVGAAIATLVATTLCPGQFGLNVGLLIAIWGCFALQRVNYALFAICITGYVVFALTAAGQSEPEMAKYRLIATLTGALLAHAIPLSRHPK